MEEINDKKIDDEHVLIDWDFPEFEKHDRSKKWYIAAVIVLGILIIYAVWTSNILFAVILILAAFIGVIQHFQKPHDVEAAITEDGVLVGSKFYRYEEIESFWMIYKPPLAKLVYLDFKNKFKKNLAIPLENVDPIKVREILNQYLEEDLEREEEELSERLAKVLKV